MVAGTTRGVASKGTGLVASAGLKVLVELVGCMWDCSGKLGRMVRGWGMPKSSEVGAKAATGPEGVGLAVDAKVAIGYEEAVLAVDAKVATGFAKMRLAAGLCG